MQTSAHVRDPETHAPPTSSPADALLWASLTDLQLNIAQTAALCGISVRQLGYWTKQGYVTASGRGERRVYDLDSLRRLLSIRRAMNEGATLRQALRGLSEPEWLTQPAPTRDGAAPPDAKAEQAQDPLPPEEADALAAALVALFDDNRHVRDSADGLALKLGWRSDHVGRVAEALCAQGVLGRTLVRDEAVFQHREGAAR